MSTTEALKVARAELENSNSILAQIGGDGYEQAQMQILDNNKVISALSASAEQQPVSALTDEQILEAANTNERMQWFVSVGPVQKAAFIDSVRALLSATSQPSAWDAAIEAAAQLCVEIGEQLQGSAAPTPSEFAAAIRALRQQAPAVQDDYGLGGLLMLVVRRPGMAPFLKRPYGDTAAYVREVFHNNPDAEITIVRSWADEVGCQSVEDAREFLAMEDALLGDDPAPAQTGEKK